MPVAIVRLEQLAAHLADTCHTSVIVTDSRGHVVASAFLDKGSRGIWDRQAEALPIVREHRCVLIDSVIPCMQYATMPFLADARERYHIWCGAIVLESHRDACRLQLESSASYREEWLTWLDQIRILREHEVRGLVKEIERCVQLYGELLSADQDAGANSRMIQLLSEQIGVSPFPLGDVVAGMVELYTDLDFLGYASVTEDGYHVEEYAGPHRERWLDVTFAHGEGYIGQASMLGQSRVWSHAETDPRASYFNERGLHLKSLLVLPVSEEHGDLAGLFFGGSTHLPVLTDQVEQALRIVGAWISAQLTRKRSQRLNQKHKTQLTVLLEVSKIMNTATDIKKVLYILVDLSLNLARSLTSCYLLLKLPGTTRAQIVSRGFDADQLQVQNAAIVRTYFSPSSARLQEPTVRTTATGETMIDCPIMIRSSLTGILSLKLSSIYELEEILEIFSMFSMLAGLTLERIIETKADDRRRRRVNLLHEAAKVWNPDRYQVAEKTRAYVVDYAKEAGITGDLFELAMDLSLLSIYPRAWTQEQFGQEEIGVYLEALYDAAQKQESEMKLGSLPLVTEVVLLATMVAEGKADLLRLGQLAGVGEGTLQRFLAYLDSKQMIDFELDMMPGVGRPAPPSSGQRINYERIQQLVGLSLREQEVLQRLVEGLNNREIADLLYISEHTVKNHVTKVFQKLEVTDRAQAIAKVYQTEY